MACAVAGAAVYAIWIAVGMPESATRPTSWAYDFGLLCSGLACLSVSREIEQHRGAWRAFGFGLVIWSLADVYWSQHLAYLDEIPYPSGADVGYLIAVPFSSPASPC